MAKISMIVWNDFRNDARVHKEAETLQNAGHEVTVFALHTPGVTRQRETLACGARVVRVTRSPMWRIRQMLGQVPKAGKQGTVGGATAGNGRARLAVRAVTRTIAHAAWLIRVVALRPDVVHAHDVNTLPTAWLASRLVRARLVYDAHEISTNREGYEAVGKLVGWVERRLMPRAAATITTTDARAKFFARAYRIPRPLVLQNRPRLAVVEPSNRIRHELQLQEAWPIILYQGGIQQGRGLDRLLDAATGVENAYFVFIGGGRLAGRLQAQAREMRLEERVLFVPTVALSELPSYTASADIGVQPIENTCLNHLTTDSNKLFEYMMAGLPVVASNLPEIRRIVGAHELGLLVRPGDTEELGVALRRLVVDEPLRTRLAANARRAASHLNWEQQERKLVDLYHKLDMA